MKNTTMNKMNNKYIPAFTMNGKSTQLTMKQPGNKLVVGKRECSSLPKARLQKICASMGLRFTESTTRAEMCGLINTKRKQLQNNLNNNKLKNANKRIETRIVAAERRGNAAAEKNLRKDIFLYKLFLGKIQSFVVKYGKEGVDGMVPSQNKFISNYRHSVSLNMAENVGNITKSKWGKRAFMQFVDAYALQFKGAYGPRLLEKKQNMINNKKREAVEAQRVAAKARVKMTDSQARAELMNTLGPRIPNKLKNNFRKFVNNKLANGYKKSVLNANNLRDAAKRKTNFIKLEKTNIGNTYKYLDGIVRSKMNERINNNYVQKFTLNSKFKIVPGIKIRTEQL